MLSRLRGKLDVVRRGLYSAADEAVSAAAQRALAEARQGAPVDTGRLRGSLTVRTEDCAAVVATDCPYAAAVELGSGRSAPKPFMTSAADAQRRSFVQDAVRLARRIF